jgi:hypothetical protein
VAYLGEVLADPLTKKQSLITTIMEVFSNIPREYLKRACSRFWLQAWMKEKRDNTSKGRGLPTLPCLYLSTFQPSQRGFFSVHQCVPGINFAIFSQKNHHNKINWFISLTPTIVDSILCTFSIPGIDFSPFIHLQKFCLWRTLSARCVCYVTLSLTPRGLNLWQIVNI